MNLMLNVLKQMPMKMINDVKCELNLSDDEDEIFDLLMKRKSIQQIADDVGLSSRTVSRRIQGINNQLLYIGEVMTKSCQ